MIERIAIFGTTGDLTPRYLLPALARLHGTGSLPEDFEISCLARDDCGTVERFDASSRSAKKEIKA